jgi:hypothetical protein
MLAVGTCERTDRVGLVVAGHTTGKKEADQYRFVDLLVLLVTALNRSVVCTVTRGSRQNLTPISNCDAPSIPGRVTPSHIIYSFK